MNSQLILLVCFLLIFRGINSAEHGSSSNINVGHVGGQNRPANTMTRSFLETNSLRGGAMSARRGRVPWNQELHPRNKRWGWGWGWNRPWMYGYPYGIMGYPYGGLGYPYGGLGYPYGLGGYPYGMMGYPYGGLGLLYG
ncbi:sulfur globule protein CV3 domain protein [Cooperia oncophora]